MKKRTQEPQLSLETQVRWSGAQPHLLPEGPGAISSIRQAAARSFLEDPPRGTQAASRQLVFPTAEARASVCPNSPQGSQALGEGLSSQTSPRTQSRETESPQMEVMIQIHMPSRSMLFEEESVKGELCAGENLVEGLFAPSGSGVFWF